MLDIADVAHVERNFSVYDHAWRFYRGILGEPFLLSNCLVYYDGRILYVCAFPFDDIWREVSLDEINAIVGQFADRPLTGINLWGRLPALPERLRLPHGVATLLFPVAEEYVASSGEHVIDIGRSDHRHLPKARKSLRRARSAGAHARVVTREYLSAEHIGLLRQFLETRLIGRVHAGAYLSIQQLLQDSATRIVESYWGSLLVGFRVVVFSAAGPATSLCSFSDTLAVRGASDIGMGTLLEYCREHDTTHLHLGYSGTPSLAAFKEKWGATRIGPEYKEAFYYLSRTAEQAFTADTFLWRDVLYASVSNRNSSPLPEAS
jgi:hypothetical protein